MATSGRVNTNTIYTGTTYWYVETNWSVSSWNSNTATISWNAYLRRSSGSKTQVTSYGVSGSVGSGSWSKSSGTTLTKDQLLGSGSFTLGGGSSITASCSGHIYGSGNSYVVSSSQTWTLDNNITTPVCTCSITSVSETSITASLTITNNGNASITENVLQIYTDSGYTTKAKSDINGTSGTWTGLSLHTTYYIRARVKNSLYYSSYANTSGQTWDKPSINSINTSALIAGNSQTVNLINPHNRNCTITVTDTSNHTLYTGSTTGTSLTFTIPADKCRIALGTGSDENQATTEYPTVNLTYTCTYSSWPTTKTGTLGINTTYVPTWSSNFAINTAITYKDTNSTAVGITGSNQILVQGKSTLAYSLALTGNQAAVANTGSGSSIKEYKVSTDGGSSWTTTNATVTDVSVGTVSSTATSVTIKIKAIDYKGLESTVQTRTILVTPYNLPTGSITVGRQNNYGDIVELTINPSWAVGSGNAGTAAWSYKLPSASTYTTGGTISTYNSAVTLTGFTFDNTLSYDFKVVLTDAFGGSSTAILGSIGPGMPILFIDETVNGVGVNTIPTEQGLSVDGLIKGEDGIDIAGNAIIGGNSTTTGTMTGKLINNYSGYVTSGTDGLSSYWFKVWDGTFTSVQYDDKCYTLQVNSGYNQYWGQICFRVRQNGANGGGAYNLTCQLYRLSGSIPLSNMRLYYNNSTGVCSLWVNCTGRYNTFNYQIISKTGRTTKEQAPYGTFYSGSYSAVQTLPSDSYATMIDITILNTIYPVGAIYMSVNSTSPATLFGGTWERLPKGKFLYNINSDSASWSNGNDTGTATNAATGNTGTTTLTAAQSGLRSHQHKIYGGWNNGGSGDDAYGYSSSYGGDRGWKTYGMETVGDSAATSSHSHTLNSHTHNIPYIAIYMWRRTA